VLVDLGALEGVIPFERMKWARPYSVKWTQPPRSAAEVLAPGALVRVRVLEPNRSAEGRSSSGPLVRGLEPNRSAEGRSSSGPLVRGLEPNRSAEGRSSSGPLVRGLEWPSPPAQAPKKASGAAAPESPEPREPPVPLALAPVPLVQGALVAVDPLTREVLALAGGYDFALSSFDRAIQAKRQPGSAFKPFVYAAALASGKFTTASIVNDAPELFRDPWTGKEWKPQNFERDVYEGPLTLREALSKSKNTVSVRLVEAVGPQAVIDLARRAGIDSPMPESMTLALGTAEVSPLELANAYATLAATGKRASPILITRVVDGSGKVLEAHVAAPEETIPPAVAYVTTSLMRSVVEMGTGVQASELHRPVAGKTGTTSESRDAWFSAFTPDLVATAWVGFDDHASLGTTLTGGLAALPIWLAFMKGATEGRPLRDFSAPPGVETVRIDPRSGLRAGEGAPGREEVFVEGTAPKEIAAGPGEADPGMLFLEDGGRRRR
jgi:penicillin-binding protein 1A